MNKPKTCKDKIYPDALHLLMTFLSMSSLGDKDKIEISDRDLHEAVWILKQRHKKFYQDIWFAQHTIRPYSPDLSQALSSMRAGGIGYSDSPWFRNIGMRQNDRAACKQHMEDKYPELFEALSKHVPHFDKLMRGLAKKKTEV